MFVSASHRQTHTHHLTPNWMEITAPLDLYIQSSKQFAEFTAEVTLEADGSNNL